MDEGILEQKEMMRVKHGDYIKQFISAQANAGRHVMLISVRYTLAVRLSEMIMLAEWRHNGAARTSLGALC